MTHIYIYIYNIYIWSYFILFAANGEFIHWNLFACNKGNEIPRCQSEWVDLAEHGELKRIDAGDNFVMTSPARKTWTTVEQRMVLRAGCNRSSSLGKCKLNAMHAACFGNGRLKHIPYCRCAGTYPLAHMFGNVFPSLFICLEECLVLC